MERTTICLHDLSSIHPDALALYVLPRQDGSLENKRVGLVQVETMKGFAQVRFLSFVVEVLLFGVVCLVGIQLEL